MLGQCGNSFGQNLSKEIKWSLKNLCYHATTGDAIAAAQSDSQLKCIVTLSN